QFLADADVELVVVDVGQAVLGEGLGQLVRAQGGQLLGGQLAVAAGAPEGVGVDLPLGAGVLGLVLAHRLVGVALGTIGLWLAQQQDVLGGADAHLGAVLALLGPTQAVGLVVLAHYVGDNGDHAYVVEAVLAGVESGLHVEGAHR